MKTSLFLAALCSLAGCLAIDPEINGKYACDSDCPSGYECSPVDHRCHLRGEVVPLEDMTPVDQTPVRGTDEGMPPEPPPSDAHLPSAKTSTIMARRPRALANGHSSIVFDVVIRNADGAPLAGQDVTLEVSTAGATVTKPLRTEGQGKTSAEVSSLKVDDNAQITAKVGGVAIGPAKVIFEKVVPASLDFITSPTGGGPAAVLAPAVQVKALDADSFAYSGDPLNVTLTLKGGDSTAVLGGGGGSPLVGGTATFDHLTVSKAGTGYQLVARCNGLDSPASPLFSITTTRPGPPAGLTFAWSGPHVRLSWSAPTSGASAVKYRVYRGLTSTSVSTRIGGDLTTTSVEDPAFLTSQRYYYAVVGVDASGNQGETSVPLAVDVPREVCIVDNAGSLAIRSTDPARTVALRTAHDLSSPRGVAVDLAHDEIFVAAEGSNSIVVLDRASPTLAVKPGRTLTGLSGPKGVALYQTTTGTIYDEIIVANTQAGTLVAYDRLGQTPKWTIRDSSLELASALAVDTAHGDIYVSSEARGTISVFKHDTQKLRSVGGLITHAELSFPYGLALAGGKLYAGSAGQDEVLIFVAASGAFSNKLAISTASGIAIDPVTSRLYVSNAGTTVNAYTLTGTLTSTLTSSATRAFGVALCN